MPGGVDFAMAIAISFDADFDFRTSPKSKYSAEAFMPSGTVMFSVTFPAREPPVLLADMLTVKFCPAYIVILVAFISVALDIIDITVVFELVTFAAGMHACRDLVSF